MAPVARVVDFRQRDPGAPVCDTSKDSLSSASTCSGRERPPVASPAAEPSSAVVPPSRGSSAPLSMCKYMATETRTHKGRLKSFCTKKGFGFVVCSTVPDTDIFLHSNAIFGAPPQALVCAAGDAPSGPEVEFDIEFLDGRPRAVHARLLESTDTIIDVPTKAPDHEGQLKSFCIEKSYGFLVSSALPDTDIFLHTKFMTGRTPQEVVYQEGAPLSGPMIEFDIEWQGERPRAVNARIQRRREPKSETLEAPGPWAKYSASVEAPRRDEALAMPAHPTSAESFPRSPASPSAVRPDDADDECNLPMPLVRLSRALVTLLRYHAEQEHIFVWKDGYSKLSEVLSAASLRDSVEGVAPGSYLTKGSTSWRGGVINETLLAAVRRIVAESVSKGVPRFELSEDAEEIWIRAMQKHSLPHVAANGARDGALAKLTVQSHDDKTAQVTQNVQTSQQAPNSWIANMCDGRQIRDRGQAPVASPSRACVPAPRDDRSGVEHVAKRSPTQARTEQVHEAKCLDASTREAPVDGQRCSGQILSFFPDKGYGFISCDAVPDTHVFLHAGCITSGSQPDKCISQPESPLSGPHIEFDLVWKRGRPQAINAQLVPNPLEDSSITKSNAVDDDVTMSFHAREVLNRLPAEAPQSVRDYLATLVIGG